LIMPGICPIVAESESEGKAKLTYLNSLIDIDNALGALQAFMLDIDLHHYALDEPLPEIPDQALALKMARREKMTLRQLAVWFSGTRGHWMPIGTAAHIADQMEQCFDEYGCDGFNIMPATFPGLLREFAAKVVPELQRRGRFRKDYTGTTLRDHLGLHRPSRSVGS